MQARQQAHPRPGFRCMLQEEVRVEVRLVDTHRVRFLHLFDVVGAMVHDLYLDYS